MEKWEYKIVMLSLFPPSINKNEQALNALGERGWELVCANADYAYLKRRLPQGEIA